MYLADEMVSSMFDEMHITAKLSNMNSSTELKTDGVTRGIKIIAFDEDVYEVTDDDQAEDMYPDKMFGIRLTAASDIADGTYPVEVTYTIGNGQGIAIAQGTKTITFTVGEGGGDDDDDDNDDPVYDEGYVAVNSIQGLTAEFAAKYAGQFFFTKKLDLTGIAATAHITISRGAEAPKTIERDLATLLGIDAEAQPTIAAGSIAVTVVTYAADVNPFTFVIE